MSEAGLRRIWHHLLPIFLVGFLIAIAIGHQLLTGSLGALFVVAIAEVFGVRRALQLILFAAGVGLVAASMSAFCG